MRIKFDKSQDFIRNDTVYNPKNCVSIFARFSADIVLFLLYLTNNIRKSIQDMVNMQSSFSCLSAFSLRLPYLWRLACYQTDLMAQAGGMSCIYPIPRVVSTEIQSVTWCLASFYQRSFTGEGFM
jgi:hypothetical protein